MVSDVIRIPRGGALALTALVVGLLTWGLLAGSQIPDDALDGGRESNEALYQSVAARVADGENYYAVTIEEQAAREFPTSPAATVREPTLTFVQAYLGETGAYVLLAALLVAGSLLTLRRMESMAVTRPEWYAGSLLLAAGLVVPFLPGTVWFHEAWALALILLSLGLTTGGPRWWPAVLVGCIAPFVRELALLYVGARFLLAWRDNRREAFAWAGGGVLFLAFYAWHMSQALSHQIDDPVASPGWVQVNGWPFIVDSVQHTTVLAIGPQWLTAVVAPLALAGWVFARSTAGLDFSGTLVTFMATFCIIGQSGNFYWGLLYSAILLMGLAFLPRGARSVVHAIRHG